MKSFMDAHGRLSASEVDSLPALMNTEEFGALVGFGRCYVTRMCKQGRIPATKVGREWRIPTRRALQQLGIE